MVETSTKIRNKQKQIWRKILMFQLYCSHLNLVLPLAVMQNINIMCMHKANSMCLWYSGYNSWIYCHDHKVPCPVYFPAMFWQLPTAMHWLTVEYHLLWLPSEMPFIIVLLDHQRHLWKCSVSTVHNPHTHTYSRLYYVK